MRGKGLNSQSHWNTKWLEEGKDTWRKYPNLFAKAITFIKPDTRLIDLGCGNGYFLGVIKKTVLGMNLIGLDLSSVGIFQLWESYDIPGIVSILPEIPYPIENSSFDYVTMMDVLEHIEDEKEAMNHAFRILKPGGMVIVGVPFDHSEKYKKFIEEDSSEHIRWYDETVLKNALTYYGKNPQIFIIDDVNIRDSISCPSKYYLGISEK